MQYCCHNEVRCGGGRSRFMTKRVVLCVVYIYITIRTSTERDFVIYICVFTHRFLDQFIDPYSHSTEL